MESIDFKKYKTPELVASLMEVIDLRGKLTLMFLIASGTLVILVTLIGFIFWSKASLPVFFGALAYAVPAGLIAGVAFAIARTVQKSLQEMDQIVERLFSISREMANDVRSLREGNVKMPTARELVQGVYTEVFLAALEEVFAKQLGFIGNPVLFAYKLTLGRMVRLAINALPDRALSASQLDFENDANQISDMITTVADQHELSADEFGALRKGIQYVGAKAKFVVMIPCYGICAIAVLIVLVPLLFAWVMIV